MFIRADNNTIINVGQIRKAVQVDADTFRIFSEWDQIDVAGNINSLDDTLRAVNVPLLDMRSTGSPKVDSAYVNGTAVPSTMPVAAASPSIRGTQEQVSNIPATSPVTAAAKVSKPSTRTKPPEAAVAPPALNRDEVIQRLKTTIYDLGDDAYKAWEAYTAKRYGVGIGTGLVSLSDHDLVWFNNLVVNGAREGKKLPWECDEMYPAPAKAAEGEGFGTPDTDSFGGTDADGIAFPEQHSAPLARLIVEIEEMPAPAKVAFEKTLASAVVKKQITTDDPLKMLGTDVGKALNCIDKWHTPQDGKPALLAELSASAKARIEEITEPFADSDGGNFG